MRYFIYFSYKGTNYHGWQRQPNGITVQEVLEDALGLILRTPIPVTGAGRTDSGVHALEMTAHFDFPAQEGIKELPIGLAERLNRILPQDIAIHKIVRVNDDAHARFSAIKRQYQYYCTERKSAFGQGMVTPIVSGLDFERMNEAAALLLKTEDFASFCKVHTDAKTTLCKVSHAKWERAGEGLWAFTIEADRFLRNMVRAVTGTLFEVGQGRMSVSDFQHVIDQRDRKAAGQSAPAEGLFLTRVEYPEWVFLTE